MKDLDYYTKLDCLLTEVMKQAGKLCFQDYAALNDVLMETTARLSESREDVPFKEPDYKFSEFGEGWIEYDGKGCPIAEDDLCEILTRREFEGRAGYCEQIDRARNWDWNIYPDDVKNCGNIVAYRLVE